MSRMENFILDHGECDTYAEPRTQLHNDVTYRMAENVAKLIPAGGKILDVGCGQGPALEWFTKNSFHILGVTTNPEDLGACRTAGYQTLPMDQNCLRGDWEAEFDLVWARHVLEHSIAPFWTLHEFNRVLKPGGVLYCEVPSPNTSSDHESNGNHYSVMGWKMWASLISRSGFEVIEAVQGPLVTQVGPDMYFSFTARRL